MGTLVGVSGALQGRSCFGRVLIWAEISYWVLQGGNYFGESLVPARAVHCVQFGPAWVGRGAVLVLTETVCLAQQGRSCFGEAGVLGGGRSAELLGVLAGLMENVKSGAY